jgi:lysozyme
VSVVAEAVALVKRFEGCRLDAYPDPATGADPWTIGYGATGPGIGPGVTWTQQQADDDLASRVSDLDLHLSACVHVPLPDGCMAALASFAYNVGIHALAESMLLRLVNTGHAPQAADEFLKWTHAGGRVFPGLVTRRTAERAYFLAALAGRLPVA